MECKKAKIELCSRLTLAILFLPFHGFANDCFQLMNHLCRDSRKLWNSDQLNFLKLLKKIRCEIEWNPQTIDETSRRELLQIQLFKVYVYLRYKEYYNNLLLFLSGDYHIEFYYMRVTFFDNETIEIYRKIIETIGSRVAYIEDMESDWDDESLEEELGKPESDKIPFDGHIDNDMVEEEEVAASSYCSGDACTEVFEYCLKKNITVYEWRCYDSKSQLVDISQYLHHSELFSSVKRMVIDEKFIIGDDSLKILSTMLDSYPNIDKLLIKMKGDEFGIDRVMRYADLAAYSLELDSPSHYSCPSSFKSYCPVVLFKATNEKKLMKFKWMEADYQLDDASIIGSVLGINQFVRLELRGGSKLAACTMYDDELESFENQQMIMDTKYIYQCEFRCEKNKDFQPYSTLFKLLQPHVKVGLTIRAKEYLTECEWLVELVMNPPPQLYNIFLNFYERECDHMMKLLVACKLAKFQIPNRGQIELYTKAKYEEHYDDEKLALNNKKKDPVDEQSDDGERLEQEEEEDEEEAKMVGKYMKSKK